MSTVTPPPFILADVRRVGVACAAYPWYYTQFSACGLKQPFSSHLSMWLQSVNYQFTARSSWSPCFWIKVSIDLHGDHDKVVYIPLKRHGAGDGNAEPPGPIGEIVSWVDFRNAMLNATWTDCSKENESSIDDTHLVSSSATGVSQFNSFSSSPATVLDNTLSFVQIKCDKDKAWLYLEKYCGSSNPAAEGPLDLNGLIDDVHGFIDNSWGQCMELVLSFQARDGWWAPGSMYHVWVNQDPKAKSVEGLKLRSLDWNDFDSLLKGARWPSCAEITNPVPNLPIEPPPPPHFSWITSSNMYNGWKLNSGAYAVAGCPGTRYHFSPNYSDRTLPQDGVTLIWNVDEWISHLETCITSASEARKMWITGDFFWSESQDGHTELVGYDFFILTQYWDEKGANPPLPPGKRIRWDDFVIKMRKQEWYPGHSWTLPDGTDSRPDTIPAKGPTIPHEAIDSVLSYATSNPAVMVLPLVVVIYMLLRLIRWKVGRTLRATKN